jgi:hypothetical protein
MTFEGYARIVDSTLERHWAIADTQVNAKERDPIQGTITGMVTLLDGSYIDFFEEVLISSNVISKRRYSYQYVKNESEVFRYDNYPNHPGLRPPYHHKHVAAKRRVVRLKEAPKLIDVLEEALRYMF